MIVDLHSHYAMHLLPKAEGTAIDLFSTAKGRARLRDRVRALARRARQPLRQLPLVRERSAGYRAAAARRRSRRRAVGRLLVLRRARSRRALRRAAGGRIPAAADAPAGHGRGRDRGAPRRRGGGRPRPGRRSTRALAEGQVALVHCVEGGFHLGETPEAVDRARAPSSPAAGSPTSSLAHLLWRAVATNAPALPFLPDWLYRRRLSAAEGRADRARQGGGDGDGARAAC